MIHSINKNQKCLEYLLITSISKIIIKLTTVRVKKEVDKEGIHVYVYVCVHMYVYVYVYVYVCVCVWSV